MKNVLRLPLEELELLSNTPSNTSSSKTPHELSWSDVKVAMLQRQCLWRGGFVQNVKPLYGDSFSKLIQTKKQTKIKVVEESGIISNVEEEWAVELIFLANLASRNEENENRITAIITELVLNASEETVLHMCLLLNRSFESEFVLNFIKPSIESVGPENCQVLFEQLVLPVVQNLKQPGTRFLLDLIRMGILCQGNAVIVGLLLPVLKSVFLYSDIDEQLWQYEIVSQVLTETNKSHPAILQSAVQHIFESLQNKSLLINSRTFPVFQTIVNLKCILSEQQFRVFIEALSAYTNNDTFKSGCSKFGTFMFSFSMKYSSQIDSVNHVPILMYLLEGVPGSIANAARKKLSKLSS